MASGVPATAVGVLDGFCDGLDAGRHASPRQDPTVRGWDDTSRTLKATTGGELHPSMAT